LNKPIINPSLRSILLNAEIVLVVVFLFFSESFSLPEIFSKAVNLLNYIFLLVMVLRLWKRMAYVVALDLSLIILIGFTVASVLWSVDVDYSLRESIGMVRTTLLGIYLATCFSCQSQLRLFAWVSMLAVGVNLLFCMAFPTWGILPDPNNPAQFAYVGIYPYKQILGRMMVLSLITLLAYFGAYPRQRWLSVLGMLGAVFLLFASRSSTYVIAAIVAIAIYPIYLIAKQGAKMRVILLLLTLLGIVVFAGFMLVSWESLVTSSGKGVTFNGRTPIWTLAIEQLMKRPLLGYGYSAFWGSDEGWQVYRGVGWVWALHKPEYDVRKFIAHNAFLDVALQLGLMGLVMLLGNIALVIYRTIALMVQTGSIASFWMLQMIAIQLVGACFEISTYLVGNSSSWVIYVAMAYGSATLLQRQRQRRRSGQILAFD
jgi:exopolysaccharide production protein ExoQ